jgi:hypothetical protein
MTAEPSPQKPEKAESVVDTLFDLAEAWAAYGLKMSKAALEGAARALTKTAHALETIAQRLEKKPEQTA